MEAGNRGGNVQDSKGKVIIDSFGNSAVDNLVTVSQPDPRLSDLSGLKQLPVGKRTSQKLHPAPVVSRQLDLSMFCSCSFLIKPENKGQHTCYFLPKKSILKALIVRAQEIAVTKQAALSAGMTRTCFLATCNENLKFYLKRKRFIEKKDPGIFSLPPTPLTGTHYVAPTDLGFSG